MSLYCSFHQFNKEEHSFLPSFHGLTKNKFFWLKWYLNNFSAQRVLEWVEWIYQAQTKPNPIRESLNHENRPMKRLGTFLECLNNLSKLPTESSETLSQKKKVKDNFSQNHDMAEYVSSYWK